MSVNINSFSKAKDTSQSGGSGTKTIYANVANLETVTKLATKRMIWGHPFDGTQDVEGDFFAKGSWTVQSPYTDKSLTKFVPGQGRDGLSRWIWRHCNVEIHDGILKFGKSDSTHHTEIGFEKIYSDGDLLIKADNDLTLEAKSMTQKYEEGHLDLGIKGDLKAGSLYTNNLYDYGTGQIYVGSPLLLDGGLDLNGDLTVKNLFSQNITNDESIRTKQLTVTGQMTVFDLVIAEISAAGGNLILSAADFRIDDVESGRTNVPNEHQFSVCGNGWIDGYYRTKYIYQIAVDSDGQKIDCKWKEFDQIISYTSNVSSDSALEMRSWWTLVLSVEPNVNHYINGEVRPCHRLEIVEAIKSPTYSTGETVQTDEEWINPSWGPCNPLPGDNCALLGSHHPDRQAAIMLSAYDTIDLHLKAPCIAQYEHIVGFELPEATTYFSRAGNRISGTLVTNSGKSITEVIDSVVKGRQTYMHQAWADSDDGALNFTKTKDREYAFVGYASNMTSTDDDLEYSDYIWTPAGTSNKLLPTRERLYLSEDDSLYLDVEYLTDNWTSSEFEIKAEIFTYGGAVTTRKITDRTNDGKRLRYAGLVQKNWSAVENHSLQYCAATVYLLDTSQRVLDSRSFQMIMDAGAIVSITDKINARVSDSEGNINSLVLTSRMLMERITSLDSSLQFVLKDNSAQLRIDAIDGRVNDIQITVDGLSAQIQSGIEYDDDWIRQRMAQFEIDVSGMKATMQSISQSAYDDSWIVKKFNDFQVTVDGLSESLRTIEVQGYDDSDITEKISTLEHTVDGLVVDVQNIKTWGDDEEISESELAVVAGQVYARVTNNMKTTGLDITNGKIELQADNTEVIGNLNIRQANESGVTVYDQQNNSCINIQPWEIGQFSNFSALNFTQFYQQMLQPNGSGYYFWTDYTPIGQVESGKRISIENVVINMLARNTSGDPNTTYPTTATGEIQIRKSSSAQGSSLVVATTFTLSLSKIGNQFKHNSASALSFVTNETAYYWVTAIIQSTNSIPSGQTGYMDISAKVYTSTNRATLIAKDGMYVNTSAKKILWVGDDGVVVQQGTGVSVKIDSTGIYRGSSHGEEVINWFSIYNYKPVFQMPMVGTYMNVPSINQYKWCACIDPLTVQGDMIVTSPILDSSYNEQETWVLLPKGNWNGGHLPAGWRIRIINNILSRVKGLYVSTQELCSMGGYDSHNVIYDANRNGNRYSDLNDSQSNDTFLWTGMCWIQLHDTQ